MNMQPQNQFGHNYFTAVAPRAAPSPSRTSASSRYPHSTQYAPQGMSGPYPTFSGMPAGGRGYPVMQQPITSAPRHPPLSGRSREPSTASSSSPSASQTQDSTTFIPHMQRHGDSYGPGGPTNKQIKEYLQEFMQDHNEFDNPTVRSILSALDDQGAVSRPPRTKAVLNPEQYNNSMGISMDEVVSITHKRPRVVKNRHPKQLDERAVAILYRWMLSKEHFDFPYPTEKEKEELSRITQVTVTQLNHWFTNARKRLWVPLRRKRNLPVPSQAEIRKMRTQRKIEELKHNKGEASTGSGESVNSSIYSEDEDSSSPRQTKAQKTQKEENSRNATATNNNGSFVSSGWQGRENSDSYGVYQSQRPADSRLRYLTEQLATDQSHSRPPQYNSNGLNNGGQLLVGRSAAYRPSFTSVSSTAPPLRDQRQTNMLESVYAQSSGGNRNVDSLIGFGVISNHIHHNLSQNGPDNSWRQQNMIVNTEQVNGNPAQAFSAPRAGSAGEIDSRQSCATNDSIFSNGSNQANENPRYM